MSARNIAQLFETCRECGQKLPRAILAKFHGPSRPLLRQGSTWDRGMIKIRKRRGNGLLLAASSARAPPKATASQRLLRSSHCERCARAGGRRRRRSSTRVGRTIEARKVMDAWRRQPGSAMKALTHLHRMVIVPEGLISHEPVTPFHPWELAT